VHARHLRRLLPREEALILTKRLLRRNRPGAYREGMRKDEKNEQHLLLMVEAALRDGRSEQEIAAIVDDAAQADAELDAAA